MELNTRRIDTSVARSETLSIINGMRYLKLGVCLRYLRKCRLQEVNVTVCLFPG